jgi:hypothetical protein
MVTLEIDLRFSTHLTHKKLQLRREQVFATEYLGEFPLDRI